MHAASHLDGDHLVLVALDREEYRELIAKVLLAALQLADVESVSPDDLVNDIRRILQQANS